jgi:hypothetical protein
LLGEYEGMGMAGGGAATEGVPEFDEEEEELVSHLDFGEWMRIWFEARNFLP